MKKKTLLFRFSIGMIRNTRYYLALLIPLLLVSASGIAQDKLAEWSFDNKYDITTSTDTTFYSPFDTLWTENPGITTPIKFIAYPDTTSIGDSSDYKMTTNSAYTQFTDNNGYGYICRLYYDATAYTTVDFTDEANHKDYFEFTFPTTGYNEIELNFEYTGGKNNADDFLEVVYSTNGGTSWLDAGSYNAVAGWWFFNEHTVSIDAVDKDEVIVRLISCSAADASGYTALLNRMSISGSKYFGGQPIDNTPTIQWATDASSTVDNISATYSGDNSYLFKPESVSVGDALTETGTDVVNDTAYVKFNPEIQTSAPDDDNKVTFNISPVAGLEFVPTEITFNTMRFGTNSGMMDVAWVSSDGTKTILQTDIYPTRNSDLVTPSQVSVDLTGVTIPASDGPCSLEFYIYSLGDTKEVGLGNVTINGTLQGTVLIIKSFPLTTTVSPEGAGVITTNPVGEVFDSNTVVTVSATKKFGYSFSHWEDKSGTEVSTESDYTITLTDTADLTAVFNTLNTYSLDLVVDGANDYMVAISPAGEDVAGELMYEEGTKVTLTASENNLVSLAKWNNNSSALETSVYISEDTTITASYVTSNYIVGWDFYKAGSSDLPAAFISNAANSAVVFSMQDAAGTSYGWLDFSYESRGEGGWHGKNCAINWKADATSGNIGDYYYQTSFSTKDFKDVVVSAAMLGSYSYYSIQNVEYSLDGTTFISVGTISLDAANTWYSGNFSLPADANDVDAVYVRFIADKSSTLTENNKDGTSISDVFITGTPIVTDDGTAPVLVSSVPEEGSTVASISGKITLTFDESIALNSAASGILGSKELEAKVVGKNLVFSYTGLDYSTEYTFALDKDVVADLSGNTLSDSVIITFTTIERPSVAKKVYDFVVGVDGDFADALDAADAASGNGNRFYIFFPDNDYNIGELTGDINQMTSVSLSNVSFIGQSSENTVIFNQSIMEAINSTATLHFSSNSSGIYMQDLSLLNKANYRNSSDLSQTGRHVALWDQGTKNIFKNVNLLSTQDTYYSGYGRHYWENGEIHGTVDFICGGGDIFFNEVLLYLEERSGNHITAPATNTDWGYVFSNCTIDGFDVNNNSYRLGRPWSNAPKAVFLNTTMNVLPTAEAWGDPMNVVPSVFAEYNSMDAEGALVDLTGRRTSYTKGDITVELDPVLTEEQAAAYTIENVLLGEDGWQPNMATVQADIPVIASNADSSIISWDKNKYAMCFGVFRNNELIEFTTDTSYAIPGSVEHGIYTIRAANEMGGLSPASEKFYLNAEEFYSTEEYEICNGSSYTFHDGNTVENITSQLVYESVLETVLGYDSTIVTTLNVFTVDTSVTVTDGNVLSANLDGASYEWVSCADESTVLSTEQSFTATEDGQYAVKVTDNGCTLTSSCYQIGSTGINSISTDAISIYPNPTNGKVYIDSDVELTGSKVVIKTISGKVIEEAEGDKFMELSLEEYDAGIYFLIISNSNSNHVFKVIKR